MNGDYITEMVNLFLERFDQLITAIERVAEALEAQK